MLGRIYSNKTKKCQHATHATLTKSRGKTGFSWGHRPIFLYLLFKYLTTEHSTLIMLGLAKWIYIYGVKNILYNFV